MDFLEYIEIINGVKNINVTPVSIIVTSLYLLSKVNWGVVRKYVNFTTVHDEYSTLYVKVLKELISQDVKTKVNIRVYMKKDYINDTDLYEEVALFSTFNGYNYSKEFTMDNYGIGSLLFFSNGVSRVSTTDKVNLKFKIAHEMAALQNAGKDICWYSFVSADKKHSHILVLTLNKGNTVLNANLISNIKTILNDFLKIKT
jgi:hypothetical protein